MNIETIYPVSPILKEHIDFFYFLRSDDPAYESRYYAFPHTHKPLNIHKQVSCTIGDNAIEVFEDTSSPYCTILQGNFEQPLYIRLAGRIDKVTIILKPLALSHFIAEPFGTVAASHSQVFTCWDHLPEYQAMLHAFYELDDTLQRAALLEDFLLSQYRPFPEYEQMQQLIGLLTDFDAGHSIAEVAAAGHMSEKTLNRFFHKHTSFSPVAFRKIARFRHSLRNKLFADHLSSLTQVGYESNYYDQSYFSRIYKNLTGANPGAFFNSIEKLADNQVIFRFILDMDKQKK